VIKRIRFATRLPELPSGDFPGSWPRAVAAGSDAPAGVRPLRAAVCTSLPEILAAPVHDGVAIEWFRDVPHLDRFQHWLASPAGEPVMERLEAAVDIPASPVLLADELVLRGAPWLDERWRRGGRTVKHMALARRADGLTQAEFSERWKGRAGTISTAAGPVVAIPERARGLAYVQNHPRADSGVNPYDALNEVYFDDIDSLQSRIEWFDQNLRGEAETDLVSQSWFVAVSEDLLWSS
jgi:hypothetical protein